MQSLKRTSKLNATPACTYKLCAKIQKPWPKRKKDFDPDLQPYYLIRDELTIVRGTYCLVHTESLQNIAHETHQGIVCSKQHLRTVLVAKNGHTGGNTYQGLYYM